MKKIIQVSIFGLVATIYPLFFSLSTSPLYEKLFYERSFFGNDSAVFLMLGKLLKNGYVPYKQFFDHKGPVIYIIECIGQMIYNGRPGIFLIQIVFLFCSLCGIYKLARLFTGKIGGNIIIVCSLAILTIYYDGGNLIEEYCLPFLIWSFYFIIRFLVKNEQHRLI